MDKKVLLIGLILIAISIIALAFNQRTSNAPTENIVSYSDPANGWQINLPKSFNKIQAVDEPGDREIILNVVAFNGEEIRDGKVSAMDFSVGVEKTDKNLEQITSERQKKPFDLILVGNRKIDGVESTIFTVTNSKYSPKIFVVVKDNKVFSINISPTAPQEEILESFEFI